MFVLIVQTTEKRNRPRRRQLVIKTEDDATKTSHSFAMENVDSIAGHNQVDHSSSSADALVCRHDPSVRIGLRVAQASPNIIRIKQEPNSELGKGSKVVIDLTQDSPTTPRPQPRRRPPPVSIKKFKQKNNLAISTSIVSPLAIVIKQEVFYYTLCSLTLSLSLFARLSDMRCVLSFILGSRGAYFTGRSIISARFAQTNSRRTRETRTDWCGDGAKE